MTTVLVLPMFGDNGDTVFLDYSSKNKAITRYGSGVVTSTAQSKFYGSSGLFPKNDSWLTTPVDSDFLFGSDDFTIEAWCYSSGYVGSNENAGLFCIGGQSDYSIMAYKFYNQNTIGFLVQDVGGQVSLSVDLRGLNTWDHVAITRQGTVYRTFLNGVLQQTVTRSSLWALRDTSGLVGIGTIYPNSVTNSEWFGYIQDFRITRGEARYTDNFTPPDALYVPRSISGIIRDRTCATALHQPQADTPRLVGNSPAPLGGILL